MTSVRLVRLQEGKPYLRFWCPGCASIHDLSDAPGAWIFDGNYEHPTLSPSVLVTAVHKIDGAEVTPRCHSYVRGGHIEYLGDCTHALAGQTVELPLLGTWPEWARS